MIKIDRVSAKKAGYSDQEIDSFVSQQGQQQRSQQINQPAQSPSSSGKSLIDTILGFIAPTNRNIVNDIQQSIGVNKALPQQNAQFQKQIQGLQYAKQAAQTTDPVEKERLLNLSRGISAGVKDLQTNFSSDVSKGPLERGVKSGLEVGSYLVPAGQGIKGAAKFGALSGILKSASEGDTDLQNVLSKTTIGAAGGAAGATLAHGLLNLGGKLLENKGENLLLKGLRPSKTQIAKFEEKTGGKLSDFVKNNKLFEKGTGQVDDKLKNLWNEYDEAAVNSGKTVKVSDILGQFDKKIAELSQYSGSQIKGLVEKLANEKEVIAKDLGSKTEVGLDWLTQNRRALDKFIPKSAFNADPISAGSSKLVRDIYKGIIDDSTGGVTKTIGNQIKNFEAFKDIAKLQQGLGKGNLPIGLVQILSAGAGSGLGGVQGGKEGAIKGALLGYGLSSAANNPKVIAALSQILSPVGKKIASSADKLIPQLAGRTLGQQTGNVIESLVNPSNVQQNPNQQQPQNNQVDTILPQDQSNVSGQPTEPSGQMRISPEQMQQVELSDLSDKTKAKIRAAYKLQSGNKPTSAAGLQVEGKAKAAVSALDVISNQIENNPNVLIKAAIPGSPGAREFEAAVSSLTDAIGGLRTGASVSKEQQKFYRDLLPKIGDSQETINYKLQALRDELSSYLQGSSGIQDQSNVSNQQ